MILVIRHFVIIGTFCGGDYLSVTDQRNREAATRTTRKMLARPEGLEPPTYRFEVCRSIQLSYGRTFKLRYFLLLWHGVVEEQAPPLHCPSHPVPHFPVRLDR